MSDARIGRRSFLKLAALGAGTTMAFGQNDTIRHASAEEKILSLAQKRLELFVLYAQQAVVSRLRYKMVFGFAKTWRCFTRYLKAHTAQKVSIRSTLHTANNASNIL